MNKQFEMASEKLGNDIKILRRTSVKATTEKKKQQMDIKLKMIE